MKNITKSSALFLIIALFIFSACKKNNNKVENPPSPQDSPELLTSMVLQLKDSATNNTNTFAFRDPDGPGGKNPTMFDTIQLKNNTTYMVSVILLDETKSPIDTVSKDVFQKRNEHQLFFTYTNINLVNTYLDKDDNGLPIGLLDKWRCGNTSKGISKITLKHQPNTKNGSINSGDTDIEVNFQTVIK